MNTRKLLVYNIYKFLINNCIRLTAAWTIVILAITLIPGHTLDKFNWFNLATYDKLGHGILYGVYTFLLIITFSKQIKNYSFGSTAYWGAIAVALILGLSMESFQSMIPGRYFDFQDLFANMVGVGVGMWIYNFFVKFKPAS